MRFKTECRHNDAARFFPYFVTVNNPFRFSFEQ